MFACCLLGTLIWLLLTSAAHASTCAAQNNYEEGGGGSWSTTANWSQHKLPSSAETVCIPAGDGTITIEAGVKAEVKTILAQSGVTIAPNATLAISETFAMENSKLNEERASRFANLTVDGSGTLSTAGSWIMMSGTVLVEGEITSTNKSEDVARLLGGTLSGNGTIDIQFSNIAGTLEPGGAGVIGELHFTSLSSQGPAGTLVLDIESGPVFDRLADLTSNFFLAGKLKINLLGAYEPPVGTKWEFMSKGPGDPTEFDTIEPSAFTARSVSGGSEVELLTAPGAKGSEPPGEPPAEEVLTTEKAVEGKPASGGGSNSGTGSSSTGGATLTTLVGVPAAPADVATTRQAIEEVLLGCTKSQLVLNDAYIDGGHVVLSGSAAKSLAGKKVKILFNERRQVAGATVGASGQFATTAPLPPAKIREALTTRYSAEIGKLRSLHLKLTRRLQLEPPKVSGTMVTLSGKIELPLTKPIAPVVVEQQLACGKTTIAKTFTPPASGRFRVSLTVPANATAGIFTLKSAVAANARAVKHGFTTYSLPLPAVLG